MLMDATIAGVFRPSEKNLARFYDITLIIGGSVFIALSANIAIRLPFSPVPVTGQTFAVLLVGALLGSRRGCLSVLTYLLEGAAGLPVFSMGGAGLPVLLGPTGGYLIGFLPAAYVTGLLAEDKWDRRLWSNILVMLFGNTCIYTLGLAWLSCLMGINKSVFALGLYPFIPGDIAKIALAAVILPAGWKLLGKTKSAGEIN